MSRTIEKTIYKFTELEDRAKEKARDWYRNASAQGVWWETVFDNANTLAGFLGISIEKPHGHCSGLAIYFSGFISQGDGACFAGSWYANDVKPGKTKEHAPQDERLHSIADTLEALAAKQPDASAKIEHRGWYSHEFCTEITVYLGDEDSDETTPQAAFSEFEESITKALRDFMRWIYRQLEAEYNYLNSDEMIDENLADNEYEFNSDGTIV